MIKINNRFYISADTNCYMLKEKTTVQDKNSKNYGNEVFKDLGYYSTIESCLKGIFKTLIREYISKEEEHSLKELQQEIIKTKKYLESLKLDV